LFVVVLLGVFGPLIASPHASSAVPNKVAVVVEHTDGGGPTHTECIPIPSDGTTALTALTRSTFPFYTISFNAGASGRALCWLDGDGFGTNAASCFGADTDPSWALWTQKPGQMQPHSAQVGIGSQHVDPGTVVYFQFAPAPASQNYTQDPPTHVGFRSVCTG
jgi:hypothetical protein